MKKEAAILDGDDRMLQILGDRRQRHIVALLVEPEPGLSVRIVEHRVADAPGQPADATAYRDIHTNEMLPAVTTTTSSARAAPLDPPSGHPERPRNCSGLRSFLPDSVEVGHDEDHDNQTE
jgi:hypothetical protein